ncbi:MAG: putative Holliday junction resolvase YggF [Candidatus Ozemobacter sibiricus]|uniref:Putative pre-16S rRNA nuclease n=1 Tax=Candidatus Ozemobacter sibiricus TaxID=2268124 RepID=A0A367ZBD3_9BACT|nr:MAG: putative Holliday junction resolvase YggF [Candidatus Ozemobacter sibiricus]
MAGPAGPADLVEPHAAIAPRGVRGPTVRAAPAAPPASADSAGLSGPLDPGQPKTAPMKFVALDIGHKRIGVATCDRLEIAASPHSVIPAGKEAPAQVAALVAAEGAEGVVVGWPVSLDGRENDNCRLVEAFLARLRPLLSVPVELVDERFTTRLAEASLIEVGMRREQRRERRDAVSASLILQSFLEARRHRAPRGPSSASEGG